MVIVAFQRTCRVILLVLLTRTHHLHRLGVNKMDRGHGESKGDYTRYVIELWIEYGQECILVWIVKMYVLLCDLKRDHSGLISSF